MQNKHWFHPCEQRFSALQKLVKGVDGIQFHFHWSVRADCDYPAAQEHRHMDKEVRAIILLRTDTHYMIQWLLVPMQHLTSQVNEHCSYSWVRFPVPSQSHFLQAKQFPSLGKCNPRRGFRRTPIDKLGELLIQTPNTVVSSIKMPVRNNIFGRQRKQKAACSKKLHKVQKFMVRNSLWSDVLLVCRMAWTCVRWPLDLPGRLPAEVLKRSRDVLRHKDMVYMLCVWKDHQHSQNQI